MNRGHPRRTSRRVAASVGCTAVLCISCAEATSPDDLGIVRRDSGIVNPLDVIGTGDTSVGGDTIGGDGTTPPVDAPTPGSVDASMYPAFLHDGRTYDQERDYIAWEGPVSNVTVAHRDGTTLPASEGGGSCASTCNESITRIDTGGRVRGRFTYVQTFSVQVAAGGEPGIGTAVIEACGMEIGRISLAGGSTLGFTNQPQPAFNVPTPGDCTWSIRAEGGWVPFRAVTVTYRGGAPPTVDVRVNGTNGPLVVDAPASYLVSWTSVSAASCVASGSWTGARDLMGSVNYTGVTAGAYTYTVTCTNGGGVASDSVSVTVNRPPG